MTCRATPESHVNNMGEEIPVVSERCRNTMDVLDFNCEYSSKDTW